MAEAAQIANLETANLNNRQQAAVQNANAFLQMDMTNLNFQQQTSLFKAQEQIKSLLTDAAAENAAKQFNATSQNQVNQFYDSISSEVSRFNAQQSNAMEQFNVSQEAALEQFNVSQENAIAQFNAQNGLVVSQANAQWRRQIATQDTGAINQVNQLNAQSALAMNIRQYEGLWQEKRDMLQFAFNSAESILDRENELGKIALQANSTITAAKYGMAGDMGGAAGEFLAAIANAKYNSNRTNTVVQNTNSNATTIDFSQQSSNVQQQLIDDPNITIGPGGGDTEGVT
jgi:CRISPR/Cas system CSM-associated protein Csm2 small subunit